MVQLKVNSDLRFDVFVIVSAGFPESHKSADVKKSNLSEYPVEKEIHKKVYPLFLVLIKSNFFLRESKIIF